MKNGLGIWLTGVVLAAAMGCDDGDTAAADAAIDSALDAALDAATDAAADAAPPMGDPVTELMAQVDMTRYADALEFVSRAPRYSAVDDHWQATQDRCADTFLAAGLQVVRQPAARGVNVIGVLPGLTRPEEQLLVGAHYDSEFGCNGADDNASGVAAVLESAAVLGTRRYARTLVFACFDAEEGGLQRGLAGSTGYVRAAVDRGDDLQGVLIFEMIGYTSDAPNSQRLPDGIDLVFPDLAAQVREADNRGDFIFMAADDNGVLAPHLRARAEEAGVRLLGVELPLDLRTNALLSAFRRSDHAPFWDAGQPGVMLTDSADYRNPNYHCALGEDDVDTIDMAFAVGVTTAGIGAIAAAAEVVDGEPGMGATTEPGPVHDGTAPLPCDPVAGTCDDGQRCLITVNNGINLGCGPVPADPLPIDTECERRPDGDECAPGLFCTLTGLAPPGPRRCRPQCLSSADCDAGQVCPWIGGRASNCIDRCDLLDDQCDGGTTCVINADNNLYADVSNCYPTGPAGEGDDCSQQDCADGLVCVSILSTSLGLGCLQPCRVSAPECTAGRICQPHRRAGLPDDLGFCVPEGAGG